MCSFARGLQTLISCRAARAANPPPDVPQTMGTRPTKAGGGGGEGGDPFKSLVQHRAEPAGTGRPPAAGSQRCAASRQPFLRCSVLAPSLHVRRPLHGGTPRCLRWGVGALEGREMFLLLAGPCLMTAPRSCADFISFTCKMLRMQTYINIRVQFRALLSLSFPLHKAQHPAPEFCTAPRLH